MTSVWPAQRYDDWSATCDTLHAQTHTHTHGDPVEHLLIAADRPTRRGAGSQVRARRPGVWITSEGRGPRGLYNRVAGADDLLITVDRGSIAIAWRIGGSS
jgi:hypothetical protein